MWKFGVKERKEILIGYFDEHDQQMAKKLMKRCSGLVVNEGKWKQWDSTVH